MGNPNPRAFSRGKRGIAGSLVFTVFDRDALADVKASTDVMRQGMNDSAAINGQGVNLPHANMSANANRSRWQKAARPHYTDEIPPLTLRA